MKAFLLHRDRNFNFKADLCANAASLTEDLGLETLFQTMADGDPFVEDIARHVVLTAAPTTVEEIRYRQQILADCNDRTASAIRQIFALAGEALEKEKHIHVGIFRDSPEAVLHRSIEVLKVVLEVLKRMRAHVESNRNAFVSEGFSTAFSSLLTQLDDDYFAVIEDHLKRLGFRGGVLISAELGAGNKGSNYTLRKPPPRPGWLKQAADWVLDKGADTYSFQLPPRDDAGFQALSRLRDHGLAIAAAALGEAVTHVMRFIETMRAELAFYIGCLNLRETLQQLNCAVCQPDPAPIEDDAFSCRALYDVCLALELKKAIGGNTIEALGKRLAVITGANQGGKSTFLRSVGLAQLMLQSGMFVAAENFTANIVSGVFTHYKREEDAEMGSGKFDEELTRMSTLIDLIAPRALVLFNESFASTNEREGSEIARQIVEALLQQVSKVFFVTHMFELAESLRQEPPRPAIFLRAERDDEGRRSFRLTEGEPLATSYGADLYDAIFPQDADTQPA
ncbi:DNA mismatch repair protein MutS [Martelella sp. HB161492]|uniref:MutS-related protein n=1 Tax=Martelella sp. HB161492 TaxID=2720726 RepID=UPI001591CB9F|nr:DNA mismatch repair protein MutS [Martelella sp. HB161492]